MPDNSCTHCPGSHTGELPCLASATAKSRAWLLIEHPGPWAENIDDMDSPTGVADAIARARAAGVRPQLIRRTQNRRATPPLRVYTAWSGGHAGDPDPWLEEAEFEGPEGLAALDLAAVAEGRPPGAGKLSGDCLLLVCTHGRHNACCARSGGPLARELHDWKGDAVWETTHVGGDRFAANLVCLPHGLYYGNLGTEEAKAAVVAYDRGEVTLDRFRGRAGLPEPAQAAEHFVRAEAGILEIDGVTVESVSGNDVWEVVVRAGRARYKVTTECDRNTPPCGTGCEERREIYRLRKLTLLNEAALV